MEMNTEHSASLGALAKALARAQGAIGAAKRTSQNPHLKSKYADLHDVWEACRKQLSEANLAVVQTCEPHGRDGVCVVTTLVHESGEWIRGRLFLPVQKADAQGFGSALTYARRYSLAAIVGVAPDDDDGEGAVGRREAPAPAPAPVSKAESDEAEARLMAMLDAAKDTAALAKAESAAAKAAKDKALTGAALERLRAKRAEVVARLSNEAAAQ